MGNCSWSCQLRGIAAGRGGGVHHSPVGALRPVQLSIGPSLVALLQVTEETEEMRFNTGLAGGWVGGWVCRLTGGWVGGYAGWRVGGWVCRLAGGWVHDYGLVQGLSLPLTHREFLNTPGAQR